MDNIYQLRYNLKSLVYKRKVNIFIFCSCTENWAGNLNYWTGGFQSCKGLWGFCAGIEFQHPSTDLIWASDQNGTLPHKENCMHLRVNSYSINATTLSAKACSNKFIYACQVRSKFIFHEYFFVIMVSTLKPLVQANRPAM
jgi:hypothetical protein